MSCGSHSSLACRLHRQLLLQLILDQLALGRSAFRWSQTAATSDSRTVCLINSPEKLDTDHIKCPQTNTFGTSQGWAKTSFNHTRSKQKMTIIAAIPVILWITSAFRTTRPLESAYLRLSNLPPVLYYLKCTAWSPSNFLLTILKTIDGKRRKLPDFCSCLIILKHAFFKKLLDRSPNWINGFSPQPLATCRVSEKSVN